MSTRAAPMAPEDRRRAIVDVVVPLLLEHGPQVSTRQIAEAAGIAEGTIFGVFPDKAALWRAAAEQTLDPDAELAELARAVDGCSDLRSTIVSVADHLLERSQRVMAVMMLVRGALSGPCGDTGRDERPGSARRPAFIVEANRALMAGLTEVLDLHREELGVAPEVAATVLRSLALGTRHPGAHADYLLTPDEVADVMLHGIARRPRDHDERGDR